MAGEIAGFGRNKKRFEQFQIQHVKDEDGREYDITIYNIAKYFQLCMENNPNMIDSLFVPDNCVLFSTDEGRLILSARKQFLHKGCWHKFKGYAYSQMHKMSNTNNKTGKRKELIEKHGIDTKYATHLVRLILEVEQILTEGDLDLLRNKEQLKAIRRGECKKEDLVELFNSKSKTLEDIYNTNNTLPYKPDEKKIKELLMKIIRYYY